MTEDIPGGDTNYGNGWIIMVETTYPNGMGSTVFFPGIYKTFALAEKARKFLPANPMRRTYTIPSGFSI
jgi:hypothetical protein